MDDLPDLSGGYQGFGATRPGYSWDMNYYGCTGGIYTCEAESGQGMSYADNFAQIYQHGTFNFDSEIYAFGMDFGAGRVPDVGVQIALNTIQSQLVYNGGFFGIASDDGTGFSSVGLITNAGYTLIDKITYATLPVGTTNSRDVSEPGALALIGLGLIGFGLARRRRG